MSRGLGELQVIALLAFAEHNRKHAADERCWHCTADGFLSASTLRELAWPDRRGGPARRGLIRYAIRGIGLKQRFKIRKAIYVTT